VSPKSVLRFWDNEMHKEQELKEAEMKKLILAAMLGMATLAPTAVPVQAASLTITTDDGMGRYDDSYQWRRHHMRQYAMRDYDRHYWRYHRDRRDCGLRVHKRWHHHRLVITKVWSCGLHKGWD